MVRLGEELDAEQVIFGTFEFTPNGAAGAGAHGSLKIAARIVDLKRLRLGPEFIETGAMEDLATLQAHLAWRALAMLAPKLTPPESEFRSVLPTVRLDAEENYIRGLLARDPETKEKFFLQAARLDARFAHPCYQLGQMHYRRKEYRQAADWLARVGPEDIPLSRSPVPAGIVAVSGRRFRGSAKAFETILARFRSPRFSTTWAPPKAARICRRPSMISAKPRKPIQMIPITASISATRCGKKATSPTPPSISKWFCRRTSRIRWPRCWPRRCAKKQGLSPAADVSSAGAGTAENQLRGARLLAVEKYAGTERPP